ncbi:hypothetical protein CEXT_716841 [Caerostris extrusa]|uniref:Uncharacterized protein n=1 Tax=Caerostris extrusa TaxID=172846 RepID=A0AAV4SCM2_CAEEX|nr:hypothetical protein CEXT_716841 [Caerostris extrusa]
MFPFDGSDRVCCLWSVPTGRGHYGNSPRGKTQISINFSKVRLDHIAAELRNSDHVADLVPYEDHRMKKDHHRSFQIMFTMLLI